MEATSNDTTHANCLDGQRDEQTDDVHNECKVTCCVPKLVSSAEEIYLGRFSEEEVFCKCGRHLTFPNQQTDDVCCHLCSNKFAHPTSLVLHLKNAHPNYSIFCKSCSKNMGPKEWSVEHDDTLNKEHVDKKMTEVRVECAKDETEVDFGKMKLTKGNSFTETQEDNNTVTKPVYDCNNIPMQTCSSVRTTNSNTFLYTNNENVFVVINKKDSNQSPKDSYTENDQQGTSVDNQKLCQGMPDHTHCSSQSQTNNSRNVGTENMHVFSNNADKIYYKDTDTLQDNVIVSRILLDHSYFSRKMYANHKINSNQVSLPYTRRRSARIARNLQLLNDKKHRNNAIKVLMSESSQMAYNKTKSYDFCEPIQEDEVIREYEESLEETDDDSDTLPGDDFEYTFSDDVCSDTSCTSSDEDCGVCKTDNSIKTKQKPLDSVNSNPANSLHKDPKICPGCGVSKASNVGRCRCLNLFNCSLCGSKFATEEMLMNHETEKHPLTKFMCVMCLQLCPNQIIFKQHVCSKLNKELITPPNSLSNENEPPFMILNFVPSPASGFSKERFNSQNVHLLLTAQTLENVSYSTSYSLRNSLPTSATQKAQVQFTGTSVNCPENKEVAYLNVNVEQEQQLNSISTVTEKIIGQGLSQLQAKMLTQSLPYSPCTSTQIILSSKCQGQITPISMVTQAESAKEKDLLQTNMSIHTPTHQSLGIQSPHLFLSQVSSTVSLPSQTDHIPASIVPFLNLCRSFSSPQIVPSSQRRLKILAMFVNQSKDVALTKRMQQNWRSKAVFPCRQCGAVSRQFSMCVRHRYQHRGPHLHRCQCGRTFQRLMHLLRHQVQHAEATRYVCTACGQMFCGTKQLGCHRRLFSIASSRSKKQVEKQCRNIFQCYCGHSFKRSAALLWHMLKNSKTRKAGLFKYNGFSLKIS